MTQDERSLIETQFSNLAEMFELKITLLEKNLCKEIKGAVVIAEDTRTSLVTHVQWHENIKDKIISFTVKGGLYAFGGVAVIALILGLKEGLIPSFIAKIVG